MVDTFSYVVMKKTIFCNIALYSYNDEKKPTRNKQHHMKTVWCCNDENNYRTEVILVQWWKYFKICVVFMVKHSYNITTILVEGWKSFPHLIKVYKFFTKNIVSKILRRKCRLIDWWNPGEWAGGRPASLTICVNLFRPFKKHASL